MPITLSANRTDKIVAMLEAGVTQGITLDEFIQTSFLCLVDAEEIHIEQRVVNGMNVYNLHACLSAIEASHQPTENMKEKI